MTVPPLPAELAARLHREADAARWAVAPARFAAALTSSAEKGLGTSGSDRETERYLGGLHLADLALACACADGHEGAWEHFVREYRPALYRAADAMAPGGAGRELADSLFGDLFGVTERAGERRSLLRYFHGRASLSTWLRAVLAQRMVDRARAGRKLDPIPDEDSGPGVLQQADAPDPERPRWIGAVQRALASALRQLPDADRLKVALYYAQDLTLAQIGRAVGEHEATVSRHLGRIRRTLRSSVERHLSEQERMTPAAVSECLASVARDAGPLDLRELVDVGREPGTSSHRKSPPFERSLSGGPGVG